MECYTNKVHRNDLCAVLTRAGFEVKSAGVSLEESYAQSVTTPPLTPASTDIILKSMSRNVLIKANYLDLLAVPSQSAHEYFDIPILSGGAPGAQTFCNSEAVLELISCARRVGGQVWEWQEEEG
jgi:protein DJ-1